MTRYQKDGLFSLAEIRMKLKTPVSATLQEVLKKRLNYLGVGVEFVGTPESFEIKLTTRSGMSIEAACAIFEKERRRYSA